MDKLNGRCSCGMVPPIPCVCGPKRPRGRPRIHPKQKRCSKCGLKEHEALFKHGWCRYCVRAYDRARRKRKYRESPEYREQKLAANRLWRKTNPEWERLNYERSRERRLAYSRVYYRRKRAA